MGVDLRKVEQEAPHLVDLYKATTVNLQKSGLDPASNKAAVLATIDCSGSTQELYQRGEIQSVADLAFAAGLVFDDDGEVPASFFDGGIYDLGSITLANCKNFIKNNQGKARWGTTDYVGALRWIVDQAGYSNINLANSVTTSTGGGFFRKVRSETISTPMGVKATAEYPTFAMFITDGEPNRGTEPQITQLLTEMSQLPIFVQFVGVGPWDFQFLHSLDDMQGRFIDNAGFFEAKNASSQQQMLDGLLNEFPSYYNEARTKGLIGVNAVVR